MCILQLFNRIVECLSVVQMPDASPSINPVSLIPVITNFRLKKCVPAHMTTVNSSKLILITYNHKQSVQPIAHAKSALFNARPLSNKTFILNDLITSQNLDFVVLTETWLKTGDCCNLVELCPPDYSYLNSPRCTGRGGGLAVACNNNFKCKHTPVSKFQSFEMLMFIISCQNPVCCIYYLPSKPNNSLLT